MKDLNAALTVPGILMLAATFAGAASAETKGDLEKRVSALEAEIAASPNAGAVKTLVGFDVSIYGYVHGALLYDDTYDLGLNSGGIGGVLPTTPEDENSRMHGYQSRLGIRGSMDTDAGKLSFNIEGDFYGSGGGTFRLRHAYGSLGGLLVGQTWSAFGPAEGSPNGQLDFSGPAGNPSWRTGQIRYTYKFSDKLSGIFSVEEDNRSGYADRVAFVGALHWVDGKTGFKLAGISRKLEWSGGTSDAWGINIGGSFAPWDGGLIQANFTTGKGIAGIMPYSGYASVTPGDSGISDLDANGDAIDTKAFTVGISHAVNSKLDLAATYGMYEFDNYAGALGTSTESIETTFLTAKYKPTANVLMGLEYIIADKSLFNGDSLKNNRIQASVQFSF